MSKNNTNLICTHIKKSNKVCEKQLQVLILLEIIVLFVIEQFKID